LLSLNLLLRNQNQLRLKHLKDMKQVLALVCQFIREKVG